MFEHTQHGRDADPAADQRHWPAALLVQTEPAGRRFHLQATARFHVVVEIVGAASRWQPGLASGARDPLDGDPVMVASWSIRERVTASESSTTARILHEQSKGEELARLEWR